MTEKEELERIKRGVRDCLGNGEFLKVVLIAENVGYFKGEFHVIAKGVGRSVFATHEDACKWASMYFLQASIMPSAKELRQK